MSWLYDQLYLDTSVNDDSFPSHNPRMPTLPPALAKMDKSVFARVLKVVIQCVEEGSALLHTFKMEGDISNTRITIEFQSHFQPPNHPPASSSSPSPPGRDNPRSSRYDSSKSSDRSLTDQSYSSPGSQTSIKEHSAAIGGQQLACDPKQSSDRTVSEEECHSRLGNGNCVREKVANEPKMTTETGSKPAIPPKKENIPNGATPKAQSNDTTDSKKSISSNDDSSQELASYGTPVAKGGCARKKQPSGALLGQVISDQNQIRTAKKLKEAKSRQQSLDEEDAGGGSVSWALDRNQNTIQRKNQNSTSPPAKPVRSSSIPNGTNSPMSQRKSNVPIDANVIVDNGGGNSSPHPPFVLPKTMHPSAQMMNHPSLITRLAKISERGNDSEHGYGSSDEDSFDSDESIEMVTDTRQFGHKTKKYAKKRKSLISL